MGLTVYQKCVKILENKKGETLNLDELKSLIMRYCGSQQVTVMTALQTMGQTGLIKDIGNYRFEVQDGRT